MFTQAHEHVSAWRRVAKQRGEAKVRGIATRDENMTQQVRLRRILVLDSIHTGFVPAECTIAE